MELRSFRVFVSLCLCVSILTCCTPEEPFNFIGIPGEFHGRTCFCLSETSQFDLATSPQSLLWWDFQLMGQGLSSPLFSGTSCPTRNGRSLMRKVIRGATYSFNQESGSWCPLAFDCLPGGAQLTIYHKEGAFHLTGTYCLEISHCLPLCTILTFHLMEFPSSLDL